MLSFTEYMQLNECKFIIGDKVKIRKTLSKKDWEYDENKADYTKSINKEGIITAVDGDEVEVTFGKEGDKDFAIGWYKQTSVSKIKG